MSTLRVNNIDTVGLADVVTNGVLEKRALPSGSVLQVVSATDTTDRSTSSATFTSAGISATITPLSATSRLWVQWNFIADSDGAASNNTIDVEYSIFNGTSDLSVRQLRMNPTRSGADPTNMHIYVPAHIVAYTTHSNVATTFTGRFRMAAGTRPAGVNNAVGTGLLTIMEIAN